MEIQTETPAVARVLEDVFARETEAVVVIDSRLLHNVLVDYAHSTCVEADMLVEVVGETTLVSATA